MKARVCETCQTYRDLSEDLCAACGSPTAFYCMECMVRVPPGVAECPRCVRTGADQPLLVPVREQPVRSVVLPLVPAISEVRRSTSGGVEAVVSMPPGDVRILNMLASLVPVLHQAASEAAGFTASSDATRKMIRQMRDLATSIQEEIETRRGPA